MFRMMLAAAVVFVSGMARGGDNASPLCYEVVGCVQSRNITAHDAEKLGCDQLWTVRNGIFAARGYCFSTARGIEAFGNENCRFVDQSEVPLNDFERANIRLIQSIEKRRGC